MEQTRLFIAIGISFLIFFGWSIFFAPTPPETPTQVAKEESQIEPTAPAPGSPEAPVASQPSTSAAPAPTAAPMMPSPSQEPTRSARTIIVDTPLYSMTLSEKGATVVSMVLKSYRETIELESPLKELIHRDTKGGSVFTSLSGQTGAELENVFFSADLVDDTLSVTQASSQIRFQYQTPTGLLVEKTFEFFADSYLVGFKVSLYNGGQYAYKGSLGVGLKNTINEDAGRISFEGPSGMIDGELQQVKVKDIQEKSQYSGKVGWVAIEDRYFMTSIIPSSDFKGHMSLGFTDQNITNQITKEISGLVPKQTESIEAKLFIGPKSLSLLRSMNNGLDKAINFGWFDFLAKPCLWFMNFIYRYIPNYGIAIIILTIVTRAVFWPLAKKSYKSMGEMRKIQPLVQELREKYKDDKQRMNQEMMTLYKTYKINPMGGCLPMLIQMPVFFALYRMLFSAIELRHAPFFGWITDLSAPDRLFDFGFKIPFMDAPYGIPVLTIVMGASMLLQQKMTPTPGDPAQAKMMMLMPVVFTFIFINFSSGLVLYWLVSNIFSMAQQYYTQRKTA
jgi:YidC/Oxa1 family membrane protein insertase